MSKATMDYLGIVFVMLLLNAFVDSDACACGSGQNVDDVHESILTQQRQLQCNDDHFAGKMDVFGSLRHSEKKVDKAPWVPNPKIYAWNGTVKVLRGILPTDTPEKALAPLNLAQLSKHGKSCSKLGTRYPTPGDSLVNAGPKADGVKQTDFEPCSERKRSAKMSKTRRLGNFGSKRLKRSESYTYSSMLWKNPSNIPYAFDVSVPETLKATIKTAIGLWQFKTCLLFRETQARNDSYILFTSKAGSCSTDRLGPNPVAPFATTIDLSACGGLMGSVAHEIGHALGLSHSQKRVDREESIKVFLPNVAASWTSQFEIDAPQYFDEWGVPYYYDSIMHYFPYAASKNGLMTVCPLDPLMEVVMGQREEPAFGDISLINHIYCQESCFGKEQLKSVQFFGNKSRTISGRLCQNWSTQMPHRHKFTNVGNHSSCRNSDNWEGGPWCYTTDPAVRYEPCFSSCDQLTLARRPSCPGWCYNGGFHDPLICKCICPQYTNGNFCENINASLFYFQLRCGGKIVLKMGEKATIKSTNYPNNYANNGLCMWWIVGPKGGNIKLSVNDFMLETSDHTGCYDYLEIRPSVCASAIERPEKMRFCGNSLASNTTTPKTLLSDDNNMVLKFYSDDSDNAKGFSILAEAVRTSISKAPVQR